MPLFFILRVNINGMSNAALDHYLNDFFSLSVAPGYAVMLDGEWGVGKSFYLKKIVDTLTAEQRRPVYVSLYGLKSTVEIDDAIFAELHPRLSDPKFKLFKKIAAGVLKSTIKIDIDSDTAINASLPAFEIPESMRENGSCIFIFDDFERCNISANELLGYINFFVEHLQLKIIIAANQKEVRHDPEMEKVKYSALKEKVIGATFKVEPDFKAAFDFFLTEISPPSLASELKKQVSTVEKVFTESNYKNLRSLRSSLLDFQRIYKLLPPKAQTNENFLSELLEHFLPLSFEVRKGALHADEIEDFFGTWMSGLVRGLNKPKNQKDDQPSAIELLHSKYSMLANGLLSEQSQSFWVKLFQSGLVDKHLLAELVSSNPIFMNEDTPNWKKLWWWANSSQAEFEMHLANVRTEISQKKHENIYVVMQIFSTLFSLAEKGYLGRTSTQKLLGEAKKYISSLSKKQFFFSKNALSELNFSRGYDGLGYNREQPQFIELVKFVQGIGSKQQKLIDANYANELTDLFSNDRCGFSLQLADLNGKASRFPVFKYVSAAKLIRSASKFPSSRDWNDVALGFQERFKYDNLSSVDNYIDEIPFFKQLDELLLKQANRTKGKVINDGVLSFQKIIRVALQKLIQRESELRSVQDAK